METEEPVNRFETPTSSWMNPYVKYLKDYTLPKD